MRLSMITLVAACAIPFLWAGAEARPLHNDDPTSTTQELSSTDGWTTMRVKVSETGSVCAIQSNDTRGRVVALMFNPADGSIQISMHSDLGDFPHLGHDFTVKIKSYDFGVMEVPATYTHDNGVILQPDRDQSWKIVDELAQDILLEFDYGDTFFVDPTVAGGAGLSEQLRRLADCQAEGVRRQLTVRGNRIYDPKFASVDK